MKLEMISRSCPICKTEKYGELFAKENFDLNRLNEFGFASRKTPEYMHYKLVSCKNCDLLYASELPKDSFLEVAYHQAAFDSANEAKLASVTYSDFLKKELNKLSSREGALDIGTGDGVFLERLLESGFTNVQGVEPSQAPIDSAKPHIKKLIKIGFFKADDFTKNSLSLVSCFQTLEHVSEPLEICKEAVSLLKRGGCAFFVVHNRRALSAKILGKKSPIFDIEHLQLFSVRSAKKLLNEAGLSDVRVEKIYNNYPLNYWLKLFPFPSFMKPMILKTVRLLRLESVLITIPAGNLAVIGYKN